MTHVLVIACLGYVWEIDATAIAHDRATYYSERAVAPELPSAVYAEEYTATLTDRGELLDWYENNMDWNALPPDARRCVTTPTHTPATLSEALQRPQWTYRLEEREE